MCDAIVGHNMHTNIFLKLLMCDLKIFWGWKKNEKK
jgi:hypothetical protein